MSTPISKRKQPENQLEISGDGEVAAAAADDAINKKKPDTKTQANSQTRADDARKWFREWFFLTPAMVEVHGMTPKEPYDRLCHVEEYEAAMQQWEEDLVKWNAEQATLTAEALARGDVYELQRWNEPQAHPAEPLTVAAWTLLEGPLALQNEPIEPWSTQTIENIVISAMKDEKHCPFTMTEGLTLVEQVGRILEGEHETAEMDIKYHPVGMLLAGILMRANSHCLSDGDLERMALAYGCNDSIRSERLEAIYKGQVLLTREFVDKHHDLGEEARGYCSARGILEDSKLALGLAILSDELPLDEDRRRAAKKEQKVNPEAKDEKTNPEAKDTNPEAKDEQTNPEAEEDNHDEETQNDEKEDRKKHDE